MRIAKQVKVIYVVILKIQFFQILKVK